MATANPSRDLCIAANPALWAEFTTEYKNRFFFAPMFSDWTEEDCQYWLDRVAPDLDHEARLQEAESVYDYYEKFDKPMIIR